MDGIKGDGEMNILCFLVGTIIGNIIVCIFSVNNKSNKCLHCDENEGVYCETCYQNLISENAKLQLEVYTYKQARQEFENQIKKENMELHNKYANHIPRID